MNPFRISFLVVADALMIAFLVSLLSACVTTPGQYRNGDFVSHMASSESLSRDAAVARPVTSTSTAATAIQSSRVLVTASPAAG